MVDLLAAVPSIIYGVWGLYVLAPVLKPFAMWLNENLELALPVPDRQRVGGRRRHDLHRGHRAGGDDPADHHRGHPRGVRPDAARPHRGRAGAGRHPVGGRQTTVLPFGLSGYISGAMLGLGRALGETIALLIILRGTQQAFGWSLFDGGYTFASKIASAASEFNDQYKAGAYIAAGLVLFILTFVVNSLARAAVAGRTVTIMTSTLDRPVKAPTFQGRQRCAARSTNNARDRAGDAVRASIALVPLVWVLYTVIIKGFGAVTSSTWWFNSQAGMTAFQAGGGAYHAIVGTLLQGLVCAVISIPIGVFVGIYLVEYGGGTGWARSPPSWSTSSPACRRSWRRCSSTPCGSRRSGFQRSGFAVSLALVLLMIPVIVRSTEEMLQHRADGSARGLLRARRAEVEDHRAHRASDRVVGHRHRHPAGAGPRHGRDRPAADPGRLRAGDRTSTCSAGSWGRCPA